VSRTGLATVLSVVLLAAAAVVGGCTRVGGLVSAAEGGTVRADGAVVRFGPRAVSRDTSVRVRSVRAEPPPGTRWLSKPVDITLADAELTGSAHVTLELTDAPSADDLTFVVTREHDGTWTSEGGVLDAGAKHMTTTVGHFSLKGIVAKVVPYKQVADVVRATKKAFDDVRFEAKPPTCEPASQLWTARASGGSAVKVCARAGDTVNPSTLRVANNRVYPQFLRLRGYDVRPTGRRASPDLVENVWRALGEANPDYTFLPGKGDLDLTLPGDYASIDFVAVPGLEPVIMKLVADVLAVVYLPVGFVVSVMQCVLGEPVVKEVHGVGDLDLKRLKAIGSALGGCVSATAAAYTFAKPSEPTAEGEDRKYRAKVVESVVKALSNLPVAGESVLLGAVQGTSRQHVVAERTPLRPDRAINEDHQMPDAVIDTQTRLYEAASRYPDSRQTLTSLVPGAGLMFGNAADSGQPDPLAGPLAADALLALVVTPPIHTGCDEIGRSGYVYGLVDTALESYPQQIRGLGWTDEAIGLIRSAGRLAAGYRVCILADGTWASFSRDWSSATFPDKELARLTDVAPTTDCGEPPVNPYVPFFSTCLTVTRLHLDHDDQLDAFQVYQRDSTWYARAILGHGRVTTPIRLDGREPLPVFTVHTHVDLDGVAGEEVAVAVSYGGHSTIVKIISVRADDLTLVSTPEGPAPGLGGDAFIIDGHSRTGSGIGCADDDHDGKPELVVGAYYTDTAGDGQTFTGVHTWRQTHTWQGKRLVPRGPAVTEDLPAGELDIIKEPPYNGITCRR